MKEPTNFSNQALGGGIAQTLRDFSAQWLHIIAMSLLLAGLYVVGILPGLDRALVDLRFLLFPREASQQVVVVQIDSVSLQQLGEWPWSRSLHAIAINNLGAAGAARIGVDIDFSSSSPGTADNDLIAAVKDSDVKIVLPVFKQWASHRGGDVSKTVPMREIAEHASLASVNLAPAADGLVREYERLHAWDDGFVPAFAPEVIGRTTDGTNSFYIDYSIRPETIPRVSFVDVVRGTFDPEAIKGKYVIIGATALELGDEIAVPVYGALSGPDLQAQAAESILLGRSIMQADTIFVLAVALLFGIILSGLFVRLPHIRGTITFMALVALIITLPMVLQSYYPLDMPAGATLVTTAYCYVHGLTKQLDIQALVVFKRSAEIRERRALNQAIADNSFTGIIVADHTGKVRFANKAAGEMLKTDRDKIIDRDAAKVILPVDDDVSLEEPNPKNDKVYTSLKIGGDTTLPVEINISAVSIEPETGPFERRTAPRHFTIYAISDISVHKQTEEVLSKAAEQAIESNRAKNEFIANMSHELRTPLNAILGFSESIKSEIFGPIGSIKYKSYAEDIFTSGSHLLSIINDLLEVSRLAAGKQEVHAAAVDLQSVISECIRIASGYPGADKLQITSEVDEGIDTLWTDPRIVKQIILNLLSNAIKFTPAKGDVSLNAYLTPDGGTQIIVSDSGIGIPPDQIERVLEPFHQVEGPLSRVYHGSGLGLHLVKSQVVLLGGQLSIESKLRAGTRITVTFPPETTVQAGKIVQMDRKS